jgi:hypothetical protein
MDEYFRQQEKQSWPQSKKDLYDKLDNLIDEHWTDIIDHYFQEKELQEIFQNDDRDDAEAIWKQRFLEYTLKAVRLVKPSQRIMNDSMNINEYVEIELIEFDDDSKWKYINGWVIKNNIADRRMRNEIKNPKILLIGNSIGFFQEESFADLETYVKQENHYIDILMDRIGQVHPDLILIEKDISRSILLKIKKMNITVVTNVSRKMLNKIARCTETLITPSVNLIEENFGLGTCQRFFVKIGIKKSIKEGSNIMSTNQSLIYFEGCKPWYGSTICLSGPNNRCLQIIKKYLQIVIKHSRDIVLEKEYLFLSDWDSINKDISPFMLPKIGIGQTSLKYTKIWVRQNIKYELKDNNYGNDGDDDRSLDEQEDHKIGDSEAQVKKNVDHICGKPEKKNIEFYSEQDETLGGFLRKTASSALEKCESCKEKMYKHVIDIYHSSGYIEISLSIKEHHPLLQAKIEAQASNENNHDNMIDVDSSAHITMHEECKRCRSFIVEKKTLSSDSQEYSFTKFIEQYFYNHSLTVQNTEEVNILHSKQEESSSDSSSSSESESSCEHKIHRDLIRTFTIRGIKIKLKFKKIHTYSIDIIKFRDIDNTVYLNNITLLEFDLIKNNFPCCIKGLNEEMQRTKSIIFRVMKKLDQNTNFLDFYQDMVKILISVEYNLENFEKDAFNEIERYAAVKDIKNTIFEVTLLRKKIFIQLFNFVWILYKGKRLIKKIFDSQRKIEIKNAKSLNQMKLSREHSRAEVSSLSKNREFNEAMSRTPSNKNMPLMRPVFLNDEISMLLEQNIPNFTQSDSPKIVNVEVQPEISESKIIYPLT